MTATTRLLKQMPNLYRRALEHTRDVNEAYLLVHAVIARALSGGSDHNPDLGPALARRLDMRRLDGIQAGT